MEPRSRRRTQAVPRHGDHALQQIGRLSQRMRQRSHKLHKHRDSSDKGMLRAPQAMPYLALIPRGWLGDALWAHGKTRHPRIERVLIEGLEPRPPVLGRHGGDGSLGGSPPEEKCTCGSGRVGDGRGQAFVHSSGNCRVTACRLEGRGSEPPTDANVEAGSLPLTSARVLRAMKARQAMRRDGTRHWVH